MRWGVATVYKVAGVVTYLAITQPENRWTLWVIVPLLVVPIVVGLSHRSCVDTRTGVVVWQRMWSWRTRVALKTLESVSIAPDRGGSLLVRLKGPEYGASRHVKLLALTDYLQKSQSAAYLIMLADQLEHWAPAQGARARATAVARAGEAHRWGWKPADLALGLAGQPQPLARG